MPGLSTENGVPLRRVATPSVLRVHPTRGYYARSGWVTVRGYGFVQSEYLSCRFAAYNNSQVCVFALPRTAMWIRGSVVTGVRQGH